MGDLYMFDMVEAVGSVTRIVYQQDFVVAAFFKLDTEFPRNSLHCRKDVEDYVLQCRKDVEDYVTSISLDNGKFKCKKTTFFAHFLAVYCLDRILFVY